MLRLTLATLALVAGTQVAPAQTVVELPSVSLEPSGCLRDQNQSGCSGASQSGHQFSLQDVINLGIIDRTEVTESEQPSAATETAATSQAMLAPLPSVDLRVFFDYDSAAVRRDQLPILNGVTADLRGVDFNRGWLIVMGHTDSVGSAAYNQDLSLRRAQSVAQYLSQVAGVPAWRIRTSGMGFDFPLYPNNTTHADNRRVQVLLVEQ